jgi:hypothetical protein
MTQTNTPFTQRAGGVHDCAAQLEALCRRVDKEADDPDEDDAWCKAEEALMAALIAATACTPEELVLKAELVGCLIDRHAPRYAPSEGGWIEGTVLNDLRPVSP